MQLSGPPRINGILRPLAHIETPVEDEHVDESDYLDLGPAGRRTRVGARRYRGRWTVGYRALTRGEALALRSDLLDEPVRWVPRTRAPDDPDWLEETEYEVRLVSDVQTLQPLWRDEQDAWVLEFELEAVEQVLDRLPNTFAGGYYDRGESSQSFSVEPYGDGLIVERVEQRTFLGQTYEITVLEFGTEPIAAMRLRDAERDDAYLIDATTE